MQYEEMLSWLLYYLSLFEVSKTPQIEIADPLGLVYSQAVESPDQTLSHRAEQLGRRADAVLALPAGIHGRGRAAHRAADRRHLRDGAPAEGVRAARCCRSRRTTTRICRRASICDPSLVEQLAAYHILYDREGEGEYFQLYSRAFAKRFFFEIVERRNYRAYGVGECADPPGRAVALSHRPARLVSGTCILRHRSRALCTN